MTQHALLVYGRRDFINPWPLPYGNGTMLYQPQARLMIGDGDALLQAAVAGCGIAFLPNWLVDNSLRLGELVPVLMSSTVDTAPIHLLWSAGRVVAPRMRVIIDALVAHAASLKEGI